MRSVVSAASVLLLITITASRAATINTQIPPFTQAGLALVKNDLMPQSTPANGPGAVAGIQFGLNQLDLATNQVNTGVTSALIAGTWSDYPSASGVARVTNGTLGVYASVLPTDFIGIDVQAHSRATFRDALTVTLSSLPSGSTGFLQLDATVAGSFNCNRPGGICNTGFLFGFGPGTLGYNEFVHSIGGEQPAAGPFSTTQSLVPLPFISGQPFDIALELIVTSRLNESSGYNTADFLNTLQITGISVSDSFGTPLAFSISSASGLGYSANGIAAIPEPGTFTIFACSGIALAAYATMRRRKLTLPVYSDGKSL